MALSPLDLQTLFVKMNDVNRDQAHIKAASAQEQALEAKILVEKEIRKDNSVNPSSQDNDMDNRIKDDENKKGENRQERSPRKEEDDDTDKKEKEYIKDPNLGTHIDLLG